MIIEIIIDMKTRLIINVIKKLILLLFLTLSITNFVFANNSCVHLFQNNITNTFNNSIKIQIEQIETHPEIIKLKKLIGSSEINFLIDFYYGGKDSLTEVGFNSGESLQSYELVKILKLIFPKANFPIKKPYKKIGSNFFPLDFFESKKHSEYLSKLINVIEFSAIDFAEQGIFKSLDQQDSRQIEMIDLKAGALPLYSKNKKSYRELLMLDSDVKIAHIYDRFSTPSPNIKKGTDEYPDFEQVFEKLSSQGFQTMILTPRNSGGGSSGFGSVSELNSVFPNYKNIFDQVYLLSDVLENKVKPNWSHKNLIINNTRAQMLNLHGASDLAIVFGPINFFEPLTVGTPTVVFSNNTLLNGYSKLGMNKLIEKAKMFPNFWVIEKWSDFSMSNFNIVQTVLNKNPVFYELLSIICKKIEKQLKMPWSKFNLEKK